MPISPGDVKWKDVNGDGVIDNYDLVKVGNVNPKWTGGFNLSATWKGLTLAARFDFALAFKVYDIRTTWIMGNMQGTYNTLANVKDTWSAEAACLHTMVIIFHSESSLFHTTYLRLC